MGDKNIKKEHKKKKKKDSNEVGASVIMKPATPQPELVKKEKREK